MKWTFNDLYSGGYIPFTIPEFIGTDPVEKSTAGIYKSNVLYTDATVKAGDLKSMYVKSNYAISDLHFIIRDENGNELFNKMYALQGTDVVGLKNYSVNSALFANAIYENKSIINFAVWEHAASGKNTLEITARVSTGELLTVYKGTLTE